MNLVTTILLDNPELIIKAAKSGWQTIKKFFHDFDAKDSVNYGDAYFDYLQNTVNSISQIKTLIYRHVPKFIYLFYECPNVRYKDKIIDVSNSQNVLDINNKLLITGIGGTGKSLLLKHLFLNIAQYGYYIPVLIELRKFNQLDSKEISLYKAIYQSLSDNGFKLSDQYYNYSLETGGYVILLDGFDEVNRDKTRKVFEQIESFSQRYHKNHFIVASRPSDRFMGWNDFHEMFLCDLTKEQALNLIQKIDFDEDIKKPFSQALDIELFDTYQSFASNPLLLTIMLLTFSNHAGLPANLNGFYELAFSTLFNGHDATKKYFVRDIRCNLGIEDFKMVFAYICFKSYFAEDFEFSESRLQDYIQMAKNKFDNLTFSVSDFKEDLTSSVCMLIKDGINYRFIHRSFQEYFAAWHTCKLTDKVQTSLLSRWISESSSCTVNMYLNMLFSFQKDKVNKIIFCPGIKKLKSLYDKTGFSISFLKELYRGIKSEPFYTSDASETSKSIITFLIRNAYLHRIIQLVCNLNGHSFWNSYTSCLLEPRSQEIIQKIMSYSVEKSNFIWSMDEILLIITHDELLYCLQGYDQCIHFCFEILNKYSKTIRTNDCSVLSILEEL